MLATTPQAPHLLNTHHTLPDMALASSSRDQDREKGFRGLFTRRAPELGSSRTKFRTTLGESSSSKHGPTPTAQAKDSGRNRQRTLSNAVDTGRQQLAEGMKGEKEVRSRPTSPEVVRARPSDLPAMQRRDDGRWQPPSLSKGSMSTSALAIYADNGPVAEKGAGKGNKQDLGGCFQEGLPAPKSTAQPPTLTREIDPDVDGGMGEKGRGSQFSWQMVSPPASPTASRPPVHSPSDRLQAKNGDPIPI